MGAAVTLRFCTQSHSAGHCQNNRSGQRGGWRTSCGAVSANRAAQGWDFADALHLALSEGCEDFTTLDADLAKRAAGEVVGRDKAKPVVTKL